MADTVFHLMTVVRVSHSSSSGVLSTTGLAENDRRGLQLWVADFGSRRSGAATVRTEAIRVDQYGHYHRLPLGILIHGGINIDKNGLGLQQMIIFNVD